MAFREQLYDRYVSTFKDADAGQASHAWWDHKYLPLLRDLPRGAPIFEIGCGGGELLDYLGRRGFSATSGIDISGEQVERARRLGMRVEHGDARAWLAEHEGAYAAIVAVDVFEHFTRDEVLPLAESIFRALMPGGRLLVQTANGAGLLPGQVISGDLTHVTIFSPQSLSQTLRKVGFADIAAYETGPISIRVRGRLNVLLWRLIRALANAVRDIETGKRQAIWTENFICLACKPPRSR